MPPARQVVANVFTLDRAPSVPDQLRRRRSASYRCEPLPAGRRRDPLDAVQLDTWPDLGTWEATAGHLRSHGLFGRWQVPDSVRAAWYGRRCPCHRDAS